MGFSLKKGLYLGHFKAVFEDDLRFEEYLSIFMSFWLFISFEPERKLTNKAYR